MPQLGMVLKFPLLLPSRQQLTNLIIQDTHKKLHHHDGGVAITGTALRQVCWIRSIRQQCRNALRRCVTCAKTMGKPYRTSTTKDICWGNYM